MGTITDPKEILMTAILSMDVYDRDPLNANPEVSLKLEDDQLGDANLIDAKYDDRNTLFGAAAWLYDGEIFIAYRGTVFAHFWTEVFNGYGVGAGSPYGTQAAQAIQFYQSFTQGQGPSGYANSGIVVTGHSLGGGLAGFVGAIYGLQGEIFDNMPFEQAASEAYNSSEVAFSEKGVDFDPLNPVYYDQSLLDEVYGQGIQPYGNDLSSLSGYHVAGEILESLRHLQSTPSLPLLQKTRGAEGVGMTDYHSQPLLVMALWAQDQSQPHVKWQDVSSSFYSALFHDEALKVSSALGLSSSDDLITEIAYSSLGFASTDNSSLPFGSSAISSLFTDADTLGQMYDDGSFVGSLASIASEDGSDASNPQMLSPLDALMEIAVQFAGDQAVFASVNPSSAQGALEDSNGVLTVNLDPNPWNTTFSSTGQHKIVGVSDLVQGILYDVLNVDSSTKVGSEKADNAINNLIAQTPPSEIDIALTSSATIDSTSAKNAYQSDKPETIAVGQKGSGTITAGDGNNLVFGGQTVTVGDGNNIIVGEIGGQTITIGGGNNIVMATGSGNTINIEATHIGAVAGVNFVYAGDGAETLNFDTGYGDAGVIIQSVTNFSQNGLLDLDQKSLAQYLNQELLAPLTSVPSLWRQYEAQFSNGLHSFDWTVILVPDDQIDNDKIEVNGATTNLVEQYDAKIFSIPGTEISPSDKNTVFSVDRDAIDINIHFPYTVKTINLNDYLTKPTAPPAPATPHANFVRADFTTPFVAPRPSDAAPNGDAVTVAQFESGSSVLDDRFGGFAIADSAANVSAAIDDIDGDGNITSITLTDPATPVLRLDASQAIDDTSSLSKITNPAVAVAVSDTAANVSANFDSLVADRQVSSITLTDDGTPTLDLSGLQVVDDTAALGEITDPSYAIAVTDTAADVSQLLDQLQGNAHVSSVTFTDSGDPTLDLSVAKLSADAGVLGTVTNGIYAIAIDDTAANVVGNAQLLQDNVHVSGVTVPDAAANVLQDLNALQGNSQVSAIQVIDTAQNVLNDASALSQVSQISAVIVEDSAPNVIGNAQALASDTQVSGIWVVDTAANILANATNLSADPQVHAQIVEDSVAAVAASFDALNADSGITGIALTGSETPTLQLTAAQALDDTSALGKLETTNIVLDVVDTAADISTNLDALDQDQQISGLTLDDPTARPLQLTAAQVTKDFGILQAITNPGYTIAVTDASANVAANIDALTANGHVASITLTDSGPAVLDLRATQVADDGVALAAIQNPYAITVDDRASNVAVNLDALNANPDLVSITLSDVMAPTLVVDAAQALADRTAIGDITNDDLRLSITDTAAHILANAAALNGLPQQVSFNVADTAANVLADQAALSAAVALSSVNVVDTAADVSSNIDGLEAAASLPVDGTNNGRLTSITLTDAGTPTLVLTASQAVDDTSALIDISNTGYSVSVADSAAKVAGNLDALQADSHVTSITLTDANPTLDLSASQVANDADVLGAISNASYAIRVTDSAANVSANIDALNDNGDVTQIALTDSGTPVLAVSADQAVFDTNVFASITGPYTVSVNDTAADVLADSSALNADANVSTLDVIDTAAAILANSAALQADHQITSVSVVDDAANIVADVQSLNADSQITSIIATAGANEALSNEDGLSALAAPVMVHVQDTIADVTAELDALNADTRVSSVVLTDSEPPGLVPTLIVTASQAVNDASTIQRITNAGASLEILDSAANISSLYQQIQSAYFNSPTSQPVAIVFTDTGTPLMPLTASEFFSARSRIASPFHVAIVDNASNITDDVYSLAYSGGVVQSVTVKDTAANVLAFDQDYASRFPTGSAIIVDTSANVAAAFDAISADSRIAGIKLTDSGPLTLSVSQALTEGGTLSEITNTAYPVVVTGSASDILNNSSALLATQQVTSLVVVDNVANILANADALSSATNISAVNVVDSVANIMANSNALGQDSWIASTQVADTASNIAANLDSLNSDVSISSIVVTDEGAVTLSATEAADNVAALHKMAAGSVVIDDTVSNVMANVSTLSGSTAVGTIDVVDTAVDVANAATFLNGEGKISSVVIQDTAANVLMESSTLSSITAIKTVDVFDTAADIGANFDGLTEDAAITSITVTDGAQNALVLTASQVSDVTFDKFVGSVPTLEVSDSAANVSSAFNEIAGAAYGPLPIASITLTDTSTPTLTLSAIQVAYYASTLGLITNANYEIDVVDNAPDIVGFGYFLNNNNRVSAISIVDSSANVAMLLDQLNGNPLIHAITLTGQPSITLTVAQATNDTSALAAITNSDYMVNVVDTAENVLNSMSTLQGEPHIGSIVVVDTLANVLGSSEALQADTGITVEVADTAQVVTSNASVIANDSWISSVTVTDYGYNVGANLSALDTDTQITAIKLNPWSADVNVDVSQAVQYATVLDKITSSNVVISDTAQNISSAIDTINGLAALAQVTFTDFGVVTLSLSVQQLSQDTRALSAVSGAYFISIHDTVANILANLSTIEANAKVASIVVVDTSTAIADHQATLSGISLITGYIDTNTQSPGTVSVAAYLANQASLDAAGHIAISDSSANVAANLDAIDTDPAVSSVTLTDQSSLSLTVAQALNDVAALSDIQNQNYTIGISDSSSNVALNLLALATNSRIASIDFTDASYYSSPVLYLNAAQAVEGASVLAKVRSYYNLNVSDNAANISAALPALNRDYTLNAITVTDSGQLAITAQEVLTDGRLFQLVHNANGSPVVVQAADAETNITNVSPKILQAGQAAIIGRLAPDLIGAELELVQSPGSFGTLSLASDASGDILYTAPADVQANAIDDVSYQIDDSSGQILAASSAAVQLAVAAPSQNPTTAAGQLKVGMGSTSVVTSLIDSLIRPGLYGVDTITSVSDITGAVAIANGVVTYTAPSSGTDEISYAIADRFGDTGSGSISVAIDSGPSLSSLAPAKVGAGHTVEVGAATLGLAGDQLTLVATQAPADGTLSLVDGIVDYTAGAGVPAGGASDTFSYVVKDQFGELSSPVTNTLMLDPGPSAAMGSIVVGHNQTVDETAYIDSLVTPGLLGDQETITSVTGNAALYNGDVTYTAAPPVWFFYAEEWGGGYPASAGARYDSFSYTATDQLGDSASGIVNVTIDPGPTVSSGQLTVGHDETTDVTSLLNGLVTPGLANDTETLTALSASEGSISLVNGTATYTSPTTGADALTYTFTDQAGDAATGMVNVSIDLGPTTGAVVATAGLETSIDLTASAIGATTPGLQGDALTITGIDTTGTFGSVSLENGDLVYKADGTGLSHIAANGSQSDSFGYTISDQYGDTATGTADITVVNPATMIDGPQNGSATIQGTSSADVINAYGTDNTIYDNGGNDVVNGGASGTVVYAGSGDVVINLQGTSNQVIGADGNITVSGSAGMTSVSLGDGNDSVSTGGSGNTIAIGAGTNTIAAGVGEATVTAGAGIDNVTLDGTQNTVTLNGSTATVIGGQGSDTIAVNSGNDSLTFAGSGSQASLTGTTVVSISDLGSALRINIGSNSQTDTISGLGNNDTTGFIDFQNGVGGYNSVNDVIAALHSDGNGGTVLSLGSYGSIDFAGTPQNQLHATNFKVG